MVGGLADQSLLGSLPNRAVCSGILFASGLDRFLPQLVPPIACASSPPSTPITLNVCLTFLFPLCLLG